MRRYRVSVSGEARRMLREQVYFLARVNPAAAEKLRRELVSAIRSLEKLPERFPYLDPEDRKNAYRKMFVPNWYLVLYLVQGEQVFVEYVLDCRQDYGWLLEGLPTEYPNEDNMSYGEMEHHKWEHGLLSVESIAFLQSLPYRIDFTCEGISVSVMHSCMDQEGHFSGSKRNPDSSDLLTMFARVESDIIIYGHDHARNICKAEKLYINVGALGCPSKDRNIARAGILKIEKGTVTIEPVDVSYDADDVVCQIKAINYPDADAILRYFYGR